MQNYCYYPSTNKEFVTGSCWQPWKKIARRRTPVLRTLKKSVINTKNRANTYFDTGFKSKVNDFSVKEVSLPKFNIFGNGGMGLSVTRLVGIEPGRGAKSGCLRESSERFSVFQSERQFLRHRKSSV